MTDTSLPDETAWHGTPRLGVREWVCVGLAFLALQTAFPWYAGHRLDWQESTNYRLPYTHSEDYWLARQCVQASPRDAVICLGDSVVWGEYVGADDALPAQLGHLIPSREFINVGINGMHPLALEGLVATQLPPLQERYVLVHCNLLWLTSPERDLSISTPVGFNHASLIPQLMPRIPAYQADLSQRLRIITCRPLPLYGWTRHVQLTGFDGQDIPHWTLEHPDADWTRQLGSVSDRRPPPTDRAARHPARSWEEQRIRTQDFAWVPLSQSRQWEAFQRLVFALQRRDNQILIVLGPFNAHLLTPASRERLEGLEQQVVQWCRSESIRVVRPTRLPSEEYGDASHPLATGYARLADEIVRSSEFSDFLHGKSSSGPSAAARF